MNAGTSRVERRAWAVALLVETGSILSSSLDLSTTMSQVAQLMVPDLADVCVIDLCDSEGSISELAVAAADPALAAGLEALRAAYPLDPNGRTPRRAGDPRRPAGAAGRDERGVAAIARPGLRARAVHDREPLPIRGRRPARAPRTRLRRAEHPALGRQRALRRGGSAARLRAREAGHAGDRQRSAVRRGPGASSSAWRPCCGTWPRRSPSSTSSGRTVFANQAALDFLGLESAQELHGRGRAQIMERFIVLDESAVSSTWTRCRRGGCSAAKTPRRCW